MQFLTVFSIADGRRVTWVVVVAGNVHGGSRAVGVEVDYQRGGLHRCTVEIGSSSKL